MTPTLRALAPGKINLCLFLGPTRGDGRHELVSLIEPVSLADELTLEELPGGALLAAAPGLGDGEMCAAGADEVVCAGIEGPNLAARALAAYRARTGWEGAPRRLTIVKRVPIAAGMGGGSGDAAAALRLAAHAAGRPGDPAIHPIASTLGSDVPSQVEPRIVLVTGAGEALELVGRRRPYALVVLPSRDRLSTPDVYREADRLGLQRTMDELHVQKGRVRSALANGGPFPDELIVNDLEPAARSLAPSIDAALADLRAAGADNAIVSGSGPTAIGLYWGTDALAAARAAADALRERHPDAIAAEPVGPEFGAVREAAPT